MVEIEDDEEIFPSVGRLQSGLWILPDGSPIRLPRTTNPDPTLEKNGSGSGPRKIIGIRINPNKSHSLLFMHIKIDIIDVYEHY